jgi:signal transduction histidine kinase
MQRGKTNLELGSNSADFNNDGMPDVFIAGWGKTHSLFRNIGGLKFENITGNLNLQGLADVNEALWFDADNDGNLDIFLTDEHYGNRLLISSGDESFKESVWSNISDKILTSQGACAGDFDNDGDMDIYVANWRNPDNLLLNNGKGFFTESKQNLPTLKQDYISNSAACADVDNDGDLDLFVATKDGYIFSYRNRSGIFELMDNTPFAHLGNNIFGLLFEDFNQDGWLDCLITTDGINRLYLNDEDGGFEPNFDSDSLISYSTGSAAADLDLDGDMDLFISNKNADCRLFLNPSNSKNYIFVKFIGIKSNRDAVGTKVFLYTYNGNKKKLLAYREIGVNRSYLSSGSPALYLNLPLNQSAVLEAHFPSGRIVIRKDLQAGGRYIIKEYGDIISAFLLGWKYILFHIKQTGFWLNTFLLLLLFSWLYFYSYFGVKRYRWHTFQLATLLIIWLFGAISLTIIFREQNMFTIIVSLIGFSIPGSIIITFYFEFLKKQRDKQIAFNDGLREFSKEMMKIYDNGELYSRFLEVLVKHPNILKSIIISRKRESLFITYHFPKSDKKRSFQLNGELMPLFSTKIPYFSKKTKIRQTLLQHFDINYLLPIRDDIEEGTFLGISTKQGEDTINKEDIHNIITIINQLLIAIDNNEYIKKEAELVKRLTKAEVRREYLRQLEKSNKELDQKNTELTRLFKELQQKESQLIHSEKMASLGQLVAGISHELNNPISFIYANMQILEGYISEIKMLIGKNGSLPNEFNEILNDIESLISDNKRGSLSVKEIVQNLKSFSRLDQAEWKKAYPVEGIEDSLKILKAQIGENIRIVKDLTFNPEIECNPGQLNQVFVNIIMNALQALKNGGILEIKSRKEADKLLITFSDNGDGIEPDVIDKIFDPFFTTKDINKGTGLGLSISYSIIQDHKGTLSVKSEPGAGTVFTIELPLIPLSSQTGI